MSDRRRVLLTLNATPGLGPLLLARVLARHPDAALTGLTGAQLSRVPGIGNRIASAFDRLCRERFAAAECERAAAGEVRLLLLGEPDYPRGLTRMPDPPPVLYCRGSLPAPDARYLAIVGSRRTSGYGRAQAERLAYLLGALGVVVASGMALGIDAAAHLGAISAGGQTVAVFGCGVDRIYPAEHAGLAQRIIERGGALISEFPLGMPPRPGHFPRRNRLIAGLSLGTLVVECALRSGSLITARQAMELNREVLAVPGPIQAPGSRGPHALIQDGAKLVTSLEDILDAVPGLLEAPSLPVQSAEEADPVQRKLLASLTTDPASLAEITRRAGLPAPRAMAALALLAITGQIRELPGRRYQLRTAR